MSCTRQCFKEGDPMYGHDDCSTCPGKDGGQSIKIKPYVPQTIPRDHQMAQELPVLDIKKLQATEIDFDG